MAPGAIIQLNCHDNHCGKPTVAKPRRRPEPACIRRHAPSPTNTTNNINNNTSSPGTSTELPAPPPTTTTTQLTNNHDMEGTASQVVFAHSLEQLYKFKRRHTTNQLSTAQSLTLAHWSVSQERNIFILFYYFILFFYEKYILVRNVEGRSPQKVKRKPNRDNFSWTECRFYPWHRETWERIFLSFIFYFIFNFLINCRNIY